MTWAIVRIRGKVRRSAHVTDTLRMLRLTRQNHCVIVPETPAYRGMLAKVKDFITWGEVSPEIVAKLLLKRGGLTDAAVKGNSRFKSVWDFSQALAKGEATVADVKGLRPVLRLHPPRGGFIAIKRPFRDRGDLGYRGADINVLIERMIVEEEA
jgi:large subunit ribosomal protein L30